MPVDLLDVLVTLTKPLTNLDENLYNRKAVLVESPCLVAT
jgi:hypothetical protein